MPHLNAAVERLRGKLHAVGRAALGRICLGDCAQIRRERDALRQWLGRAIASGDAYQDRVVAAIVAFRDSGLLRNLRQARFACYGCTQALGVQNYRLIEDRPLLERLLDYVGQQRYRTRAFRKCYFGLLGAYFAYDAEHAADGVDALGSRELLRQFLDLHQDYIEADGHAPPWVAALRAHPQLLARDPCLGYGFAELRGDWAPLDDLRARLDVGSESWLMRKLVLAQVAAVAELDDAGFAAHLASVLLLLDHHPLHAAAGLGRLLERQARCAGAEVAPILGARAVALWGNPWLSSSAHLWQCSPNARERMARWLRRRLLRGFFAAFVADDAFNRRRLAFWDSCADALVGMYFALGQTAFAPGNGAVRKFRQAAKGLIVRLESPVPDRHVLILQFERCHVVELSGPREAAYFYSIAQGIPPFYLSKGWIDIGALSVSKVVEGKSLAPLSKPMAHRDVDGVRWERRFAAELGSGRPAPAHVDGTYPCGDADAVPRAAAQAP
ncbi:MAG: hypothetical protein HZC24_13795 [Rhodocyclales bacterium]|nr:hypothetical protein [Rhodocyclales bacterium]